VIEPVTREVMVDVPIERAFEVFTRRFDAWWPRDSHHIGEMPAIAVLEPEVGGRMYSLAEDGTQSDWGRVLEIERPSLLRFAWLLTPEWEFEPDAEKTSDVTVAFAEAESGRTRVTLTHAGFERYAADGPAMRDQVDGAGGWTALVELYARYVDAEVAA
jgi:uncharacterized protein YndB with AHSA1/START domain